MKPKQLASHLNCIIHRRNLYVRQHDISRRVIDARVISGRVFVRDLYTEADIEITTQSELSDGHGQRIFI